MVEQQKPGACHADKAAATGSGAKASYCPVCQGKGRAVRSSAVKHFVREELATPILNTPYYFCLNEDCEVAYFSLAPSSVFRTSDIKMPIWFKKDADPKYICYCNLVTEQQIIDAVRHQGAKNIQDIIRLTGAMHNSNCAVNNPLGVCCGPVIQETINKALENG